jgi:preprotein translocase SecF subunit
MALAPGVHNIIGSPASEDRVGKAISNELIYNAIIAIIIGSFLIFCWIMVRYNIGGSGWKYSAGGILALIHDLCITVGMFAILRHFLQVNSPFIAAFLTVLGYSIHDTIVIYDRIRENLRLRKGRTFAETVNISLLETLARSVNTVLTVMFTLLALFFFGGSTLRDFVAALLIGVTVGAYSSICIASQLLVSWAKGKDRVILPLGQTLQTATAGAPTPTMAQTVPIAPAASIIPSNGTAAVPPTAESIQRARQAGKTSKRKR